MHRLPHGLEEADLAALFLDPPLRPGGEPTQPLAAPVRRVQGGAGAGGRRPGALEGGAGGPAPIHRPAPLLTVITLVEDAVQVEPKTTISKLEQRRTDESLPIS